MRDSGIHDTPCIEADLIWGHHRRGACGEASAHGASHGPLAWAAAGGGHGPGLLRGRRASFLHIHVRYTRTQPAETGETNTYQLITHESMP